MSPLLVFRLGYMAHYDGVAPIYNGGSWIDEHGEAGEMWNFRVENGECYGYVMSQNSVGIDLRFINPKIEKDGEVDGIDIIFIATQPTGGQVVVGWYKNATVYHKTYKTRPRNEYEIKDEDIPYLCEVDAKNAFLLPEKERTFSVPYAPAHGKGYPGMSNVWYPNSESDNKDVVKFILKLRKYVDSSSIPAIGELFEMPIEKLVSYTENLNNSVPRKIKTSSTVYERNPILVTLAKKFANGKCRLCNCDAPFENKSSEPYLEVHHIQWLSKDGSDALNNVVALCPNCHRKMHILNLAEDVAKLTKIAASQ